MKNLLNCHTIGLHSFPVSLENGLYKRIFCTDKNHHMWKPMEIAVQPHHVDIKITVLEGRLINKIYKLNEKCAPLNKYKWESHILNGKGGFTYLGQERIALESNIQYKKGESCTMKACELHTVHVPKDEICVWLIEESVPTCEYFPINYSIHDLTKWNSDNLYKEVDDSVKEQYIGKYLNISYESLWKTK